MNPKVSICVPAYKQPDFLRRTLQSIFLQSFHDYEVIVTDDSPDNSVNNVIKEFQSNHKLKYYKNKERKGSPENWNEAIKLTSGEYIKFLHHDDWFSEKDSLAEFVKMLDEKPNANFAFSATLVCNSNQEIKHIHCPTEEQIKKIRKDYRALFFGNIIGAPSATIYRKKVNKNFDPKLKWLVDLDFYIDILKENQEFVFCTKPLICTTDGAEHQLTRECAGNRNIEVFEWVYLYNKIEKKINFQHFNFFWGLFEKYNINSLNDILELGIQSPVPDLIKKVLLLQNILNKIKKGVD
ncbi:MAG: glycosyltransferase family 2 protein [Thermincolia bacterium]